MTALTTTRTGVLVSRFVAAAILLALVVTAALWWVFSGSGQHHVTAFFTRAVGVYPGSDVRVLGVRIGQVDAVTPRGEQVQVDMSVDGSVGIAEDTTLLVIAPSVVADRYLQFGKPARGGPRLPDGALIPVQRTATPVELDQLYASLDTLTKALGPNGANSQGALSDLLKTGAQTLQGNGRAFNDSVRNFAQLARTLAGNSGDLFGTVDQLQRFTTMLATNDQQVSNVNQQLSQISTTLAANSGELAQALDGLGRALADVQAFIHDNRGALKANVDNLVTTTRTLVEQRESLAGTLDAVPLAVTNVLQSVDPATGRLLGRGDLDYYLQQPLPLPVTGDVYTNGGQ
ncbi:MCE family protein [Amycolatopsis vastitatis]|uniref:ABC transporter substrate-binding protein n=1 Tax=Amycolatopsis vastitatis TaxID=1905142 RepID=A0A229SYI5_9PSEU|nr:MCE family protein [Amycolatopsis vastitatis]OXM63843.1 ABC transporter substrate-binding protein [Amycolatopsis vastitatis]